MSRTRYRYTAAAAAAALTLLATGCGGASQGTAAGAAGGGGATKITVLLPNPSAINVFNLCAAIGEGFMKAEGIDVTVQAVDGSGAVLQAMVAGQAQIGLPGPGPVLNVRSKGEDVRMFYNSFAQSLFGLVAPAKSGIQSVKDLKGKVVGVGTAEGAEVSYARGILAEAGMKEHRDYTMLAVGDGGQATAAFQRGDIAVYSAAVSDMAILEARGLPLREITPPKFLAFFGNGFAATGAYMDKNPKVIQGFVNALVKGNTWALANKAGTLKDCEKINPEEGMDTKLASALYDAITVRSQPTGGAAVGVFPAKGWEDWQKNLIDSGELPGPAADLTAAYNNTFVQNAS